jgi:hypothetical protein
MELALLYRIALGQPPSALHGLLSARRAISFLAHSANTDAIGIFLGLPFQKVLTQVSGSLHRTRKLPQPAGRVTSTSDALAGFSWA